MPAHDQPLREKVAIVTGASRGIGKSIAVTLAENGCRVVAAARGAGGLESLAAAMAAQGREVRAVPADMASEEQIAALVRRTIELFGRIDIVVNNAAEGIFGPLEKATAAQWERIMTVNARGPFLLCREAIPHLRAHPISYIVNIGSVVGVKGYANQSIYSAAKHAVMGWTKALAREVQKDGIRVHAVCPGGVDTAMAALSRPDLDPAGLISPREIADLVLFLVTRSGKGVVDSLSIRRDGSPAWDW